MAGKLNASHDAVFNNLLTVCQLRGRDATGVIRVKTSNEWNFAKRVGTPELLIDSKSYDREIMNGLSKVLIGHCRAKTVGQNITRNAHPFDFENVIGVHNGTLRGHYQHEGWTDMEVDSELLYYHINKYGVDEAISSFDEDGAWALSYWNKEDKTLNFIRNKERPLYFTHSKDLDILLWASEAWMLGAAMRNIPEWEPEEGKASRWLLPVDTLYSFSIDYSKTGKEVLTMKTPREIKGKEVRSYSGNSHGWGGGPNVTRIGTHHGGQAGSANGGEVVRPFDRPGETDWRDDNIDDLYRKSELRARLLRNRERMRTQAASTTIAGLVGSAANSSLSSTGSPTDSKNIGNGQRPVLSLPSPSSKSSLLDSNGNILSMPGANTGCSAFKAGIKKGISLRTVAGINFITDNRTGREFSEQRFEQETDAVCCHCTSPVGALEEVAQIFIHENKKLGEEFLTFLCVHCLEEPFA